MASKPSRHKEPYNFTSHSSCSIAVQFLSVSTKLFLSKTDPLTTVANKEIQKILNKSGNILMGSYTVFPFL